MRKAALNIQIGYEPDSYLAESQIKGLVASLNKARIQTSYVGLKRRFQKSRVVRLPFKESQDELRRLVEQWQQSGPNLRKLFEQRPELKEMTTDGVTRFWPTDSGRGHLEWEARTNPGGPLTPLQEAVKEFMNLLTNPLWQRLGGPCPRCKDYFWKKRADQTHCTKKCSTFESSVSATKRAREREHSKRIRRAQDAIDKLSERNRGSNWKEFVAGQNQPSHYDRGILLAII
jgi:hypothetical protein